MTDMDRAERQPTRPALSDQALSTLRRLIWALCVGVYLLVYGSGVLAHGSELGSMLRASGLTLAMAILGRVALGVLGRATQPAKQPLMADQEGTVGSLIDLVSSPMVEEPRDEAAV